MKKSEYRCKKCLEIWGFSPQDYKHWQEYPTKCPLCTMPIRQMIQEVYRDEGLKEVARRLLIRLNLIGL
jgi:NAD-dependent SIR2 family protein deacetylase